MTGLRKFTEEQLREQQKHHRPLSSRWREIELEIQRRQKPAVFGWHWLTMALVATVLLLILVGVVSLLE